MVQIHLVDGLTYFSTHSNAAGDAKKRLLLWSEEVTQNLHIHRDVIIGESGREKTFIFIKGCIQCKRCISAAYKENLLYLSVVSYLKDSATTSKKQTNKQK